jgi:hypothetical protein
MTAVESWIAQSIGVSPRPEQAAACFGLGKWAIPWRPLFSAEETKCSRPRVAWFVPSGTFDNSPAIYRWDGSAPRRISVPKGRQIGTAKNSCQRKTSAKAVSQGDNAREYFFRPYRDLKMILHLNPAISRWAMIGCPCGTKSRLSRTHFMKAFAGLVSAVRQI